MDLGTWNEEATESISLEAMDELVKDYREQREKYDEMKKESGLQWEKVEAVQNKIFQALEKSGKKSYKVDGVGTFSIVQKQVVTTPKTIEEKAKLFDYIESKYGEEVLMAKLSINHQSLNSFYNQEFEAANDPTFTLPGVGQPTVRTEPRFRKG